MAFLFIFELIVLFFLSRVLTSQLSFLFYKILRSRKIAIWLMAIIFLPGTLIHEMAHATIAKLFFVYVGKIELMPQVAGDSLKLGSVEVGKTDIVRNFLIGIAPFVVGSGLLLLILYFAFTKNIFGFNILTYGVLYLLFVIANTMYSSKKDMEGAIEFILLVVVPVLVLYYLGVRVPGLNWSLLDHASINSFFRMSSIFIGVPIITDIAFILFAKIITGQRR